MGMSLFFSAFIVALVVQWKLALITMSIVPAMILTVGGCVGILTPIETEVVSPDYTFIAPVQSGNLTCLPT